MNIYIRRLNAYLEGKAPSYGYTDANSLMEMLYYYYTEENPIETGVIRCQLHDISLYLDKLSNHDADKVFDVLVKLIGQCEKEAFLQGLQTGLRLTTELEGESCAS